MFKFLILRSDGSCTLPIDEKEQKEVDDQIALVSSVAKIDYTESDEMLDRWEVKNA